MVVVTMLGLTAMRTSRIEEQLAGATYDHAVARAAGDAALVDSFMYVFSPVFVHTTMPAANVLDPVKHGWTIESWRKADFDWSATAVNPFGKGGVGSSTLAHVGANPTYVVESMPPHITQSGVPLPMLRSTVRAVGARTSTEHYSMAFILLPSN
jgi:hypothetical protein